MKKNYNAPDLKLVEIENDMLIALSFIEGEADDEMQLIRGANRGGIYNDWDHIWD